VGWDRKEIMVDLSRGSLRGNRKCLGETGNARNRK
jgi:hypothetical protein